MTAPLLLSEPYATALVAAEAFIRDEVVVRAIVVSGTVVRGTGQASSDLDIVVVHDAPWRQRLQRFFNDVPTEIFVNPAFRIRDAMVNETTTGRPVMAHMLATGHLLHDHADGVGAALQQEARVNLAAGPRVSEASMNFRRYAIATAFEDAVDLLEIDEDRAQSLLTEAVVEAVKWHFLNRGVWMPRSKALLADLDALDPDLGRMVRSALRTGSLEERLTLATQVVERTIGVTGFFEWESEPEPLTSNDSRE